MKGKILENTHKKIKRGDIVRHKQIPNVLFKVIIINERLERIHLRPLKRLAGHKLTEICNKACVELDEAATTLYGGYNDD